MSMITECALGESVDSEQPKVFLATKATISGWSWCVWWRSSLFLDFRDTDALLAALNPGTLGGKKVIRFEL